MKCPKCESENTQRLEVVFHGGTQTNTNTSVAVGAVMRGGGFGALTRSSGMSQSTLAQAATPPQVPKESKFAIACLIVGLMFGGFPLWIGLMHGGGFGAAVFGFVVLGLCSLPVIADTKKRQAYNRDVFPGLYQTWKDSWLCHKCGTIYHQP